MRFYADDDHEEIAWRGFRLKPEATTINSLDD
jgi:hypothetical protein